MGWLEQRKRERDDELLSAYIDGQLLGRARSEFEARLAREPELRARLEATRRMLGMVRSLPALSAPRNFILDLARHGAHARSRSTARFYPTLRLATALATLILLVVFAGDLVTQASPAARLPQLLFAPESDRGARASSAVPTAAPQAGQPVPQAVPQAAESPAVQPTRSAPQPTVAIPKAVGPQVKTSPSPPASGPGSSQSPGAGGGQTDMQATPSSVPLSGGAVPVAATPTPPASMIAPSPVLPTPTAEASPIPPTPAAVGQAPPAVPPTQPPVPASQGEQPARPVGPSPWRVAEGGLLALVIVLAAATILARRSA